MYALADVLVLEIEAIHRGGELAYAFVLLCNYKQLFYYYQMLIPIFTVLVDAIFLAGSSYSTTSC